MATAMWLAVQPGSAAHRLIAPPDGADPAAAFAPTLVAPARSRPAGRATPGEADIALELGAVVADSPASAAELMTAGIQEITNAMVESFKLNDVLRMVLETMLRALRLGRIVFCLRDPKTNVLAGRFGLGAGADDVVRHFPS
jgi:hypothetical protein